VTTFAFKRRILDTKGTKYTKKRDETQIRDGNLTLAKVKLVLVHSKIMISFSFVDFVPFVVNKNRVLLSRPNFPLPSKLAAERGVPDCRFW